MPSGMSRILDILEESIITKTIPSNSDETTVDNSAVEK